MLSSEASILTSRRKRLYAIAIVRLTEKSLRPILVEGLDVAEKIVEGVYAYDALRPYRRYVRGNTFFHDVLSSIVYMGVDDTFNNRLIYLLRGQTESDAHRINVLDPCFKTTVGTRVNISAIAAQTAEEAYVMKTFDVSPILADMLEDDQYPNQELMDHLRSNCKHHRGCWAYDILTGRS